jgi:glycosyltransferase involved in cell wall biosynthesis
VGEVVRGALQHVAADRIVVVDDGSVPPVQPADVCGALLLRHARNRGLSAAIATAAQHALTIGADGLIKLDADGQMDTEALPRFRAALDQG